MLVRVFEKRWHWWGLAALAVASIVVCSSLLWTGRGLTESKARRIVAGMSREEVQGVLGPPNFMERELAFWDSRTLFGCHYVSLTVYYDAAGKVDKTLVGTYSRDPWDVVRRKLRL